MKKSTGKLINRYIFVTRTFIWTQNTLRGQENKIYTYRNLCEFKNRFIVYFEKYHLCQFTRSNTSWASSAREYAFGTQFSVFRWRHSMPNSYTIRTSYTPNHSTSSILLYSLFFFRAAIVDAGHLHLYGIINLIIIIGKKKSTAKHQITLSQKEIKKENQFSAWHILFSLVPSLAHSLPFSCVDE